MLAMAHNPLQCLPFRIGQPPRPYRLGHPPSTVGSITSMPTVPPAPKTWTSHTVSRTGERLWSAH
jgi:hypothetical protein